MINVFKTNLQIKCKNKCWLIALGAKNMTIIYVQKNLILMINKENKNEDKKKIKHINELEIIVSQFLTDWIL